MTENEAIVRINCAGTDYTDSHGNFWAGESHENAQAKWKCVAGERGFGASDDIDGTEDPELFRTCRQGRVRYAFDLDEGRYDVTLHMAETDCAVGVSGARRFNVYASGKLLACGIDPLKRFGLATAGNVTFAGVAADGESPLELAFDYWTGAPFVNAIELAPSSASAASPGPGDSAMADADRRMCTDSVRGNDYNLAHRNEIPFPVALAGLAGDGPHRATFKTTLGEGFANITLTIGVADFPTRFRVLFDGREIASAASYFETSQKKKRTSLDYGYLVPVSFAGEHTIEVRTTRWDERGDLSLINIDALPMSAPTGAFDADRATTDLWGWSHILAEVLTDSEDIDTLEVRAIAEPWRWGANAALMLSATPETRFRLPDEESLTSLLHSYSFLSGVCGLSVTTDESPGLSFPAMLTTATEWAHDFTNVGDRGNRIAMDFWALDEEAGGHARDQGVLCNAANLVTTMSALWDFNPGLAVAQATGVAGGTTLTHDVLHEGVHGPNYIKFLRTDTVFSPGGSDSQTSATLFPEHLGFSNDFNRVFRALMADCRYYSTDGRGGLCAADWIIKQAGDWFRQRLSSEDAVFESGIFWAAPGEKAMPEPLRETVYAVCCVPVRAAVVAPLESTSLHGRFHWIARAIDREFTGTAALLTDDFRRREDAPATATGISNNTWRVIRSGVADGGILQYDPTSTAHFDITSPSVQVGRAFGATRPTEATGEVVTIVENADVTNDTLDVVTTELEAGVYDVAVRAEADADARAVICFDGLALGAIDRDALRAGARLSAAAVSDGPHRVTVNAQGRLAGLSIRMRLAGELKTELVDKPFTDVTLRCGAREDVSFFTLPDDEVDLSEQDESLCAVMLEIEMPRGGYLVVVRAAGEGGEFDVRMDEERFGETPESRLKATVGVFDTAAEMRDHVFAVRVHEEGEHDFTIAAIKGSVSIESFTITPFPVAHQTVCRGGHVASVDEETELTWDADSLLVRNRWQLIADLPVVQLRVEREWSGRASELALLLGFEHAGALSIDGRSVGDRMDLSGTKVVTVEGAGPYPPVHLAFRDIEAGELRFIDGVLSLVTPATQTERISIDVVSGAAYSPQQAAAVSAILAEAPVELLFADTPDIVVTGPDAAKMTRLATVVDPTGGPYFVQEGGWWRVRGGQPHADSAQMQDYYEAVATWAERPDRDAVPARPADTDYLSVKVGMGAEAHVQQGDFIDNIARPGGGCQHTIALKDVGRDYTCTAKVLSTTAFLFAPKVEFSRAFAFVKVNGEDWAYFDENCVMLPSRPAEYSVKVSAPGARRTVYLARTAACVTACRWDTATRQLVFATEPGDHVRKLPEGLQHRALIKFDVDNYRLVTLENAELIKRVAAAVVIKFTAGDTVVCQFATYDEEEEKAEEETANGEKAAQGEGETAEGTAAAQEEESTGAEETPETPEEASGEPQEPEGEETPQVTEDEAPADREGATSDDADAAPEDKDAGADEGPAGETAEPDEAEAPNEDESGELEGEFTGDIGDEEEADEDAQTEAEQIEEDSGPAPEEVRPDEATAEEDEPPVDSPEGNEDDSRDDPTAQS